MAVRPSLTSVAREAGVSPSTVSNAYNHPDRLSAAVRTRILEIAAARGYAGPDLAGRSLRSRQADTIGVLFGVPLSAACSHPSTRELLAGLAEVAERRATSVLLLPVSAGPPGGVVAPGEVHESALSARRALIDGAVADGLDGDHPALSVLNDRGLPVVRTHDCADQRCVVVDDHAAARGLGEHLLALGHRRVAVLAESREAPRGARGSTLRADARARLEGLRAGLGDGADVVVVPAGADIEESGERATARVLALARPPTAVVALSDVLALGALTAARARGLAPGRDVTVTGFDDVPDAARAGLTTVRQPVREKGRLLASMLLDPARTERRVVLPTELVVRTSSGPPLAEAP